MPYKFYTQSEKIWKAMYEAILSARESVYLEMYIFTDDMLQYNFLELLSQKAKEGLRVRIILDSWGSFNFSKDAERLLTSSGAELFFYSHIFRVTHRKVLVVDGAQAFLGGVNFSQNYRHWDDLVVEIRGNLVDYIVRSFAKVYAECGGTDPQLLAKNQPILLDKTRSWLVEHFPRKKKPSLKHIYKEHLNKAQKNIIFITPYFIPNRWLVRVLKRAVQRGVTVDVLISKNAGYFIASLTNRINYFYIRKLSRLGVSFYIQSEMNHSKALILDEREAIVGSQNIDFLSFELSNEIGVFIKDAEAVKKLLEIYNKWKKEATLFDFKTYKPRWFDYIISPICSLFSKIF